MAKFVCVTQEARIASFTGPSGNLYRSYRGQPLEVTNKLDLEFFKNKRQFEEYNFFKKPKVPEVAETDLSKLLDDLKVSNKSKETLLALCETEDVLKGFITQGVDLSTEISKTDAEKVTAYINKQLYNDSEE